MKKSMSGKVRFIVANLRDYNNYYITEIVQLCIIVC